MSSREGHCRADFWDFLRSRRRRRQERGNKFSKVLYMVTFYSTYTRALTFENVLFQVPLATPSMIQFDTSTTPGPPSRRGASGPGGGGGRASTRLESPSSPPSWQNISKVLHIVTLCIKCNVALTVSEFLLGDGAQTLGAEGVCV